MPRNLAQISSISIAFFPLLYFSILKVASFHVLLSMIPLDTSLYLNGDLYVTGEILSD